MLHERPGSGNGWTSLGWRLLAPAAAVGALLLLLALLGSKQLLQREARERDLARTSYYLQLAASLFAAEADEKTPEEILAQLHTIGIHSLELLPADYKLPAGNPRYVTPGSVVEAWRVLPGPGGEPVAVLRIKRPADFSLLILSVLRYSAAAAAIAFVLLLGVTWISLDRQLLLPLRRITGKFAAGLPAGLRPADSGENPLDHLASVARHATRHWQAQDDARQRLLDGHSEMACASTVDGTLTEVNAAYCRLFGQTREELVGRNGADLIPPADRTEALDNLRKLSPRQPENLTTHRVILPDGSIRWTRWRDIAIFGPGDKVTGVLSFGSDISAERQLADELDQLRRAFDQMQSLALTGSFTWDLTRDRMQWTDQTFRLLGLDQAKTTPSLERLLDCVVGEDRGPLQHLFANARETGRPFSREFRTLRPDGSHRVLQSRAEVLTDPRTKLLDQLTCTLRDITALRDAESATRRELRFRLAIEQSLAAGVVVNDDEGRILSVNPAFCEMTGWKEEELLQLKPPYPYWPEEELTNIGNAFARALIGHTPPGGFELRFCRRDGTRFDALVNVAPLLDRREQRFAWLGAVTDISAIQQTRRELLATNERLQIAQDVAEFGIWDWDPQRDKLFWDRQSFAIFGHPEATDPEVVWQTIHLEEERERLTSQLKRLIASGGTTGQDLLRIRWPDGSTHEVLSTYLILRDETGTANRVLGINRDITEEVEAEQELRDANRRLAAALEGGNFGTFEHIIGTGDVNWSPANYEINGIDPAITDPAELFAVWKKGTGDFYPALMERMSTLPVTQNDYSYDYLARPAGQPPRRIRTSIFIERDPSGQPVRLVGVTRRIDDPAL